MGRRLLLVIAALFAAGLASAQPPVSAASTVMDDPPPSPPAIQHGDRFSDALACPVTTGSVLGVCPRPLVAKPVVLRPMLRLCASSLGYMPVVALHRHPQPSVCGTGFHPASIVFMVISSRSGSTLWRVLTDRAGDFDSPLPWTLCEFPLGRLLAFDQHDSWASALALPQTRCR